VFIQAYQTRRYHVCGGGLQERGYEKIVIYADGIGIVRHAARQISDGRWLSKLGDEEDIIHETPQSLASPDYGQPVCYLRRAKWPFLACLYSWAIGSMAWFKTIAAISVSSHCTARLGGLTCARSFVVTREPSQPSLQICLAAERVARRS